jgi:ABC-2 type transport system ATP-binding protein
MIEAKGLTKMYGAFRALDKVSFHVSKGEVVGFLGPNGAGKSTTMRILTCYLSATGGSVKVHGHDVFDEPLAVRQKLGYLPQRATMYGEMNVWEYLRFVAEVRGIDEPTFKKRMHDVVDVCGLSTVLGKDIQTLSHGYRQRVGLGQALIHDPPILILDEPTSDLDPNEKAEVIEYIKEIGRHRTVILSTHNLAEVEAACARAIIIAKGRVVADGAIDDVRARGGRIRYHVIIHEKEGLNGAQPPTVAQLDEALRGLPGVISVQETPTDDRMHAFALLGPKDSDLRAEIFRLCVQRGWLLLEMRREVQKLEDVFKSLTRADELLERGRAVAAQEEAQDDDEELEDDEEEEEEEEEKASPAKAVASETSADDEDDEEEEEEEEEDEDDEEEEEEDEDEAEESEESDEDEEDEEEDDEDADDDGKKDKE